MNIDLEGIILNSHSIKYVRGAECDYDAEITCECEWEGSPSYYGSHLLVALGLEKRVIADWQANINGYVFHPLQVKDYLNIFRGPKDQYKFTKEERKEYNNLWRRESR